jgi:hypothetical protein
MRVPSGCWEWQGARRPEGYGNITYEKRTLATHRASYELFCGPIPDGAIIRHTCDNPRCCHPAHLTPGTQTDNMADMHRRRRARPPRGSKHFKARLVEADIPVICSRVAGGESRAAVARDYGIAATVVSAIVLGQRWKHVTRSTSGD